MEVLVVRPSGFPQNVEIRAERITDLSDQMFSAVTGNMVESDVDREAGVVLGAEGVGAVDAGGDDAVEFLVTEGALHDHEGKDEFGAETEDAGGLFEADQRWPSVIRLPATWNRMSMRAWAVGEAVNGAVPV